MGAKAGNKHESGSYQIHMRLKKDAAIRIGSLGSIRFPAGRYVYTGSAMRNLEARVARHMRKDKKIRWHIDYFLDNENVEIISIDVFPSNTREECRRNLDLLEKENGIAIAKGFGSSDCSQCPSHLIYFKELE